MRVFGLASLSGLLGQRLRGASVRAAEMARSKSVETFSPVRALVVSHPALPSLSHISQVSRMSSTTSSSFLVWASTTGTRVLRLTSSTQVSTPGLEAVV